MRQLVVQMVSPLRVSRGAIVHQGICPANGPELDAIIWYPTPMPAVFECGEFALVPSGSAWGFLEIKRSTYSGVGKKIAKLLDRVDELIPHPGGVVLKKKVRDKQVRYERALGVVCIREQPRSDPALDRLASEHRAIILLEQDGEALKTRVDDMLTLLNFLAGVRRQAYELGERMIMKSNPSTDEENDG